MSLPIFLKKLDDWVNPIAVKEMRQAVNGRFIEWTLLAFLLIQLAIAAGILLFRDISREDFGMGRQMFMGLLGVLLGTCLFYIPISTGIRFSSERSEHNVDLFFITTLQPVQIIWGKTVAATTLLLLFFSAAMPFLTLTYLLRGLDIPSAFVLLVLDFLVVSGCVQLGILLACVPGKIVSRGFCLPIGVIILFVAFFLTLQASVGMLYTGVGSSMMSADFWRAALTFCCCALMIIGLLFVLSVTAITPRSANKALGVRIYILLAWLISGIIAAALSFESGVDAPIQAWELGMVALFCINMFIAICERQEAGPRVLRAIPKSRILRAPAFFLYSGAAGGVSFSILFLIGTILLTVLFVGTAPSFAGIKHSGGDTYFVVAVAFAVYAIGYSLTGLAIKRAFFSRSRRPNIVIEIMLMLLLLGEAAPLGIGYLFHSGTWDTLAGHWYMGNPLAVFWQKDVLIKYLPFAGIWALVAFAVSLPWIIQQFHRFRSTAPAQTCVKQSDERGLSTVPD